MAHYANELTLRDALARYFKDNGFGVDGGYADDWVDLELGPVTVPFPNTASRKRAVRYHDLHHLVTEYETDLAGEFEISAWEIGSGCRDHYAAWQLNLGGLAGGILSHPVRTFDAFARGRHGSNFYAEEYAPLLDLSVGEAKARLGAGRTVRADVRDAAWFVVASVAGLVVGTLTFVVFWPLALLAMPFLRLAARRARSRGSSAAPAARS